MKAEFKEEKKEVSHVGLYSKINGDGLVVFFCNEEDQKHGVVVASDPYYKVGHVSDDWVSCDSSHWEKLEANTVTFTW